MSGSERTFSIVEADSPDAPNTLDNEFTDVSPELLGSTALKASWYIGGTIASAASNKLFSAR